MKNKTKNILIGILCGVIALSLGIFAWAVFAGRTASGPNPNVTLVAAPDQTDFEEHPEWTIPVTEPIDYGENIALEKDIRQNGQTQIYNCRNINDGDRFTYWEGAADSYPNELTIDLGSAEELSGARILLNPRQIWGARTQEVEVLLSDDGENFTTIYPKTTLSFDPMEDNCAYMEFSPAVCGQYILFRFYSNSGASAGQAAEIEVYKAK